MSQNSYPVPPPNWQPTGGPTPEQPAQQPPIYPNQPAPNPQPYGQYYPQNYQDQSQYPPGYQGQYPPSHYGQPYPGHPYAASPRSSDGRKAIGIVLLVLGSFFGLGSLLQVPAIIDDLRDDPAQALGRVFGIFLFAGLPFIIGLVLLVRRPR